ncbi:SDR family oxidoreductase [Dermatobacter hominis]|uniref:SDR family oxidoreductase n=1 Tax=Dermatobacter hominis TaxID=2884263 RepID=UPI001D12536E|nr:SDR family oxidoreductase [Dermatobacter hominis]UDY34786.1 SDR family oxidoreductase [Dermatobacter hominis]
MTIVVITGAASGMGAALRARLEGEGTTVIGVDLPGTGVTVEADLATVEGRVLMADRVAELSGGAIDGLVAGAGMQSMDGALAERTVRTNHFGAVATLELLRPLLARGSDPSAVAISSNSTTTQPGVPPELADVLLAGDEDAAVRAVGEDAITAYPVSKLALGRWVRRHATTDEWIGAGIRLNAIAPGFVDTAMTAGTWDFVSSLGDTYPIPIGRPGRAEELAALLAFLLSPDAGFFVGSFITVDGGTEARVRAEDWPGAR